MILQMLHDCVLFNDAIMLQQDEELISACRNGRLEDARSAFQRGADPNWKNEVL